MAEIKTIQVNGTTLAYQEFGQGDKYLLSMQNFFLTDCHASLLGQPPYDYHVFSGVHARLRTVGTYL